MIILPNLPPSGIETDTPLSPLHAVWRGRLTRPVSLPNLGHLHLLLPLDGTAVSAAGVLVAANRYLLLGPERARTLPLAPARPATPAHLLLLWLSPGFVAEMADFLGLDAALTPLLAGIPLPQGDDLARLLRLLARLYRPGANRAQVEELVMEVVGIVLQQQRLRQQTLLALAPQRATTTADLLPRLLQARQYIEAHTNRMLKVSEAAAVASLSEYHFARLFKAAFGETVHQFGLRLRLDAARRLLETTDTAVTEIAAAVGYRSLSAFIHAFGRRFGPTPSAYRAIFQPEEC